MSSHTHRPRVIRKAFKFDRKGRPKAARDRKNGVTVERVTAHVSKHCTSRRCHRMIEVGTDHAVVKDPNIVKRLPGRYLPDAMPYHFECVPENAVRLVRFVKIQES